MGVESTYIVVTISGVKAADGEEEGGEFQYGT